MLYILQAPQLETVANKAYFFADAEVVFFYSSVL